MNNDQKTIIDKTISLEKKTFHSIPKIQQWKNYKIIKTLKENNQCVLFLIQDENNNSFLLKVFYPYSPFNIESINKIKELSQRKDFPPFLTKILDYGFDEQFKSYYIIEEYIPNQDLSLYIKNQKNNKQKIEPNFIITFTNQMNQALNYLHQNEIIHCDIKPSNILIRSTNPLTFSITDYNISSYKPKEIDIKSTTFKLTPAYAAPERFSNIISPKTDYWSLGITILELLTLQNPFENIEPNLIIYQLLTKGIEIPDSVPENLKTLLNGLLTNNPEKRWGFQEIKLFLEGKKSPIHHEKTQKLITYKNKEYSSLEELLLSFLKNYDEFKAGIKILNSNEKILKPYIELFNKFKEEIKDDELALNLLINQKFPSLPPYICTQKLNSDTIINILRKISNKQSINYEEQKIINLLINYLENKSPNIKTIYDYFKNNHIDQELEIFLFNLKKFILPPSIDKESLNKLAFTITAINDKNYYLPQNFINFKIVRDTLQINLPVVTNLLTIEEINNLRINLNQQNPYYARFQTLLSSPIQNFLVLSEYFKNNLEQILKQSTQPINYKNQQYIKILKVLSKYLQRYKIDNRQVTFLINNPQMINDNNFWTIYNQSLDILVYRINSERNRTSPVKQFIILTLLFLPVIFFIILCFVMINLNPSFVILRYLMEDLFLIIFCCIFFLLLLLPIVLISLSAVEYFARSKSKITKEQLRRKIEYEAQTI